jgi:hypothetical protein
MPAAAEFPISSESSPIESLQKVEGKKAGKLAGGPSGGPDAARLSLSAGCFEHLLNSSTPSFSKNHYVARSIIFRKRLKSTYKHCFERSPNGYKRSDTLAVDQHIKRPQRNVGHSAPTPAYNPSFSQSRISAIVASTHMHMLSRQRSDHTTRTWAAGQATFILPPFLNLIDRRRMVIRCLLQHITNRIPSKVHATATHYEQYLREVGTVFALQQ